MTGAITTLGIVVGMTLVICYRLMARMPKRRVVNGPSADHSGPAGGADVGDGGGRHFAWSAGEDSASGDSAAANDGGGVGLDRFQSVPGISLESLEKTVFPFASRGALEYLMGVASRTRPAGLMIVCSCHVLTDDDVRNAVSAADDLPRSAKQIYGCLGCSAECGRCARTLKTIIDEALGACAKACCSGCPHSQIAEATHLHSEFSVAATL